MRPQNKNFKYAMYMIVFPNIRNYAAMYNVSSRKSNICRNNTKIQIQFNGGSVNMFEELVDMFRTNGRNVPNLKWS